MATAQGTPESDTGSFECFQNYTAPEVFIQGLAGIVDQQDVESMIRAQKQMLQRFEKTNEMLTNCNQLSVNRLKTAGTEFKKHTALLVEMKKDLDHIFKRIRLIKSKLNQQYPQAFNEAVRSSLAEEVIVEDMDCGPKPLEPEVVTVPILPTNAVAEGDPDSDGQGGFCNNEDSIIVDVQFQSRSFSLLNYARGGLRATTVRRRIATPIMPIRPPAPPTPVNRAEESFRKNDRILMASGFEASLDFVNHFCELHVLRLKRY